MQRHTAIEIAQLRHGDVPRLRALNALFAEVFSDAQSYAAHPPDDDYLARLLADDSVIVLVALDNESVVGGLVAYALSKFEQARREVYIYDLGVAEAYRRRGIATELIGRLQRIAKDLAAWVIFVQADYGDDPAIALYEKLGVREEVLHFDIPVVSSCR